MDLQKKRSIILFSGYNFRAVVALCRQMSTMKIPFAIIALCDEDPIFSTKYKNKVKAVRDSANLNIKEVLPHIMAARESFNFEECVILPTSEFLNHFLLENQAILERNSILLPLPNKGKYDQISNKESFAKVCEENDLLIPPEVEPLSQNIPFVFKPKENIHAGHSLYPKLIFNEDQLNNFILNTDLELYSCQKYIPGKSFYLLYHICDEDYSCEIQENILQQSDGKSILWAKRKIDIKEKISQQYGELLTRLKFRGLIMVEIKEFEGQDYLIEANPRPWGPIQLVQNTPLILTYLQEISGFSIDGKSPKCSYSYTWLGGIVSELLAHRKLSWYTKEKFMYFKIMKSLLFNDVFLKVDTIRYFFKELKSGSTK